MPPSDKNAKNFSRDKVGLFKSTYTYYVHESKTYIEKKKILVFLSRSVAHMQWTLKTGHVQISNGWPLSGFRMVRILNGQFSNGHDYIYSYDYSPELFYIWE